MGNPKEMLNKLKDKMKKAGMKNRLTEGKEPAKEEMAETPKQEKAEGGKYV